MAIEEPYPGFLFIRYYKIQNWDFANAMLRLVMPAGYDWRLESPVETDPNIYPSLTKVYRNRVEDISFDERSHFSGDLYWGDELTSAETIHIVKRNQPAEYS